MEGSGDYESSWLRLSDGLLGGIHHALNNRMAALGGAVQVLESDLPASHPLIGAMSGEIQRLEATTGLLRLLRSDDGEPAAIQIEEILAQGRRLFDVHHAMRDLSLNLTSQPGLLPLRTSPAELLRTIFLMMAASARGSGHSNGEVAMTVSGDETWLRIAVDVGEPDEETDLPEIDPAAISGAAERLGGEFELLAGTAGTTWELRVPTLLESRRREGSRA